MSQLGASSSKDVQQESTKFKFLVTLIAIFSAVATKDGRVYSHKCNQSGEIVDDTHLNYLGGKVNLSWPRVTAESLTVPGQHFDFCMTVDCNGRYYGNVYEAGTNIPALKHNNSVKVWAKPGVGPSTPPTIVYTVEEHRFTATPPAPAAGLSLPSGEGVDSGSKATPSGEDSASGSKVAANHKKRKGEDTSVEEENLPSGEGKRRRTQSQKGKDAAESEQLMRNWTDKGKEAASSSPRRRPVARRSAPRPQQQQQQQHHQHQQAPQLDIGRRNSLDSLDTLTLVVSVQCVEMFEGEPSDEETEAATILAEMSE